MLCLEKQRFLDRWLKNYLYSVWIVLGKVDTLIRYKWFCKNVDVLNMGDQALKSLISVIGKKHIDHTPSDILNTHF